MFIFVFNRQKKPSQCSSNLTAVVWLDVVLHIYFFISGGKSLSTVVQL